MTNHNCNLCKKTKVFCEIGNVCFGERYRGKIIDKDDTICDEYEFGGFIELSEGIKNIPTVSLNTGREMEAYTNLEPFTPTDEWGGQFGQITYKFLSKVMSLKDEACIESIRLWAMDNGYDDVLLMDEDKLKEILRLGSIEYEKIYGGE